MWLLRREIKAGTESEVTAAKDETLQSKYQENKILKTETENTDLCQKYDETLDYDMSAYPVLAKEQ